MKFTPEILSLGDQNVHESAAKPWGEEGWTDIIENALVNEVDDSLRNEYEEEVDVKEEIEVSCHNINQFGAKTFKYPSLDKSRFKIL